MTIRNVYHTAHADVKVWTDDICENTVEQLRNTASLPIIHGHVAAMPDTHLGRGATIGSVFATREAIIPAAVGVDIGCGMVAVRTSLRADQLPDSLRELRRGIERRIPLGPGGSHREAQIETDDHITRKFRQITAKHEVLEKRVGNRFHTQLGTLGSGNHFVEVCLDESDDVWVMLHSGSRGTGNQIGSYFIEKAKYAMGEMLGSLPDKDLAYLRKGTELYDDYCFAVETMQQYAARNRQNMLAHVVAAMQAVLPEFTLTEQAINCHHNYVSWENHFGEDVWVTRKGAIRAREGELGIIPGSMGTRSYIVRGLGNEDSFCSCSHGAGRNFSRKEAKRRFTVKDLIEQTEGIECRKDQGGLDEIPAAYKDIDKVMSNQTDLVTVEHTLRQVLNIKG